MKLSIITINYNNRDGLKKTIESIIHQTFKDFEHIIIDGGSNDGSIKVIHQYEDHFAYWVTEKDKGIYNAMNKGTQAAQGEYCLFLNSGDILVNNEALQKAFQQNPTADIVSSDLDFSDHTTLHVPEEVTLEYFIKGSLPHPSTFIRKKVLEIYPYDERYKIMADRDFFLHALVQYNVSYQRIKGTLSLFDQTGISTTTKCQKDQELLLHAIQDIIPPRVIEDYDIFMGKRDKYHKLFYMLSFSKHRYLVYKFVSIITKIIYRKSLC